jgi:hypothetical protein
MVRFSGLHEGRPLLGRASNARLDRASRLLVLEDLDYVHLGCVTSARTARFRSGTERGLSTAGPASRLSEPPPAVAAALAALPALVVVPELRLPTAAP